MKNVIIMAYILDTVLLSTGAKKYVEVVTERVERTDFEVLFPEFIVVRECGEGE